MRSAAQRSQLRRSDCARTTQPPSGAKRRGRRIVVDDHCLFEGCTRAVNE